MRDLVPWRRMEGKPHRAALGIGLSAPLPQRLFLARSDSQFAIGFVCNAENRSDFSIVRRSVI
ncbi:MAG: hypothetical protein U0638_03125 [Phycisphaerales bacterium]